MGKFFSNIVSFFIQKPLVFLGVFGLVILILINGFTKVKLDEDIYSILPKSEQFKKFNNVIKENNLNKQVVFSVNSKNKDIDEVIETMNDLSSQLTSKTKGLIKGITVVREIDEMDVLNNFYANFPGTLSDKDYELINTKLNPDSIQKSVDLVNKKLSSNSFFVGNFLAKDPLGISWNKLKSMNPHSDSSEIEMEDGVVFYKNQSKALFFGILNFELNDNKNNEKLNLFLEKFKKDVNAKNKDLGFDFFGTFQISYANSKQIKKDTNLTMVISISLIFLLLFLYYRSVFTPLYFILPTIFGGLCGIGVIGYFQPTISVISIATSAVLLGIVLDYSFHFFTHYKHSKNLLSTVKDLSFPMLVGSFTTVAAFASLLFTDSIVLQNFGLIAISTLLGAAIFSLMFLPVLLTFFKFKFKEVPENVKTYTMPKWGFKVLLYGTILCTFFFYYKSSGSQFDSDINNLSFHTQELIDKEEFYTGINPKMDKKIHLIVSSSSFDDAILKNYKLYKKIENYKENNHLKEVLSLAPFYIPKSISENGNKKWERFWASKKALTIQKINVSGKKYDFSNQAFAPFEKWISHSPTISEKDKLGFISKMGLNNLIHHSNDSWSIITSVVVKRLDVKQFKNYIHSNSNSTFVFDISDFAENLMNSVKEDFNFLLIISSLIVFLTLLLIYGRIELALLNFLPMLIAWVWILGFSAVFDIKFNFVNIIIATFIFGLGDDFTIFVTEGLLQKYKYNKTILKSYYVAIILSALSTIIGIGALYFAKHPSIHSIAVISVVGIICTLIVTLYIQPKLFNLFIQNRVDKKRVPVTCFAFLLSISLYGYFVFGCILLNLLLVTFLIIPVSKKKKRSILNYLISKMTKSTLDIGFHVKRKIIHPEKLDFSKPSVIILNHSSFLDILLVLQMNPKVIIMVKKWVYNSPFFGLIIRYSGYVFVTENVELNKIDIEQRIAEGYSIAIFPEGTRSFDGSFSRFHKGAFLLATELKLDIQPIVIAGVQGVNCKNDVIIKSGTIIMNVMDRIKYDDPIFSKRFGLVAKYFSNSMHEVYKQSYQEYINSDVLRHRVLYNFIYKGPVLEWYIRIKLLFERQNFEYYDKLIGERKTIYDVGCGYGYLGYYLHYRDKNRKIIGVDYDDEKIQIAANGFDKTGNLQFETGDVRLLDLKPYDVIFFNDVLHYLTLEEQLKVLTSSVEKLNENGIIFIRDGISDLSKRHETTRKTERYSTKIFNFNKTTNELTFFSSKDIFMFAEKMNLSCEMLEQSKKTSNVLFILKK